jgi:hypothetical protein
MPALHAVAVRNSCVRHPTACRNDLLKKVERLVAANPDIMKMEIRHAQDGDYKADIQVRQLHVVWGSCSWQSVAALEADASGACACSAVSG